MAAAKLGLVGLGNLGMEFGLRAVAASRSVVAHDASPRLALAGAARAGSVGAVVAAAPTVVSVVPDDAAGYDRGANYKRLNLFANKPGAHACSKANPWKSQQSWKSQK